MMRTMIGLNNNKELMNFKQNQDEDDDNYNAESVVRYVSLCLPGYWIYSKPFDKFNMRY